MCLSEAGEIPSSCVYQHGNSLCELHTLSLTWYKWDTQRMTGIVTSQCLASTITRTVETIGFFVQLFFNFYIYSSKKLKHFSLLYMTVCAKFFNCFFLLVCVVKLLISKCLCCNRKSWLHTRVCRESSSAMSEILIPASDPRPRRKGIIFPRALPSDCGTWVLFPPLQYYVHDVCLYFTVNWGGIVNVR